MYLDASQKPSQIVDKISALSNDMWNMLPSCVLVQKIEEGLLAESICERSFGGNGLHSNKTLGRGVLPY